MTWNPDYNPPTAQRTSKPLPRLASETTADNPWPVSLLSEKFYTAVERWPSVWVAGQITQINTRRQGSAYITLRDDQQDIAMEVNGFGRFAAAAAPFVQGDRVIIHGILHLLGYDHVTPEQERQMFGLQRQLLLTFFALRQGAGAQATLPAGTPDALAEWDREHGAGGKTAK